MSLEGDGSGQVSSVHKDYEYIVFLTSEINTLSFHQPQSLHTW